jgi:hypothetical protein
MRNEYCFREFKREDKLSINSEQEERKKDLSSTFDNLGTSLSVSSFEDFGHSEKENCGEFEEAQFRRQDMCYT